ncbi:MAG: hypothetical protein ACFFD2_06910 [Promethearchaeota archaeon]
MNSSEKMFNLTVKNGFKSPIPATALRAWLSTKGKNPKLVILEMIGKYGLGKLGTLV